MSENQAAKVNNKISHQNFQRNIVAYFY